MARTRSVKTAAAALAPPASAAARAPREVSMADALENPVSGLGMPSRDKRASATYGTVRRLNEQDLRTMFRKSWLAGAIVSTPVEDMTREGWGVQWQGMAPTDEQAITRIDRRYGIKAKMVSGLTWGSLLGGGAIIPVIEGQNMSEPLDMNSIRPGSVKRFIVKDRSWVYPLGVLDRDIENSDNYGMPTYYGVRGSSVRVHASRVKRFEGREVTEDDFLTNGYWHDSQLQHVVTATMDYDGSVENVASLLWEMKLDVIKTKLAELLMKRKTDGGMSLEARYQDAVVGKSNHRILLINSDEEYDRKQLSLGGVSDVLVQFVVQACAAARIPMVKLFGQSAPGMNSTGENDTRLYYDRIKAEFERIGLPVLLWVYELAIRSELGRLPEGFDVVPNSLWQDSGKDQATIEYQRAQRDQIYLKENPSMIGAVMRQLKKNGTYQLTDEEIKRAESMSQEIPKEPEGDEPVVPAAKKPADQPAA